MKTSLSLLVLMIIIPAALAEGVTHHEPSISDLLYPAVNFVILVAFLIWKLKKPTEEMFNKKAEDVRSLMVTAAEKNKEAESRLSELQGKMKNLDSEVTKIVSEYHADVANFAKVQAAETQTTISRIKKDLETKLEGEKNEIVAKMNQDLLDSVVAKTQEVIKGSGDMKNRVTQKIVSELR